MNKERAYRAKALSFLFFQLAQLLFHTIGDSPHFSNTIRPATIVA
jgi:hypothetical protein